MRRVERGEGRKVAAENVCAWAVGVLASSVMWYLIYFGRPFLRDLTSLFVSCTKGVCWRVCRVQGGEQGSYSFD